MRSLFPVILFCCAAVERRPILALVGRLSVLFFTALGLAAPPRGCVVMRPGVACVRRASPVLAPKPR